MTTIYLLGNDITFTVISSEKVEKIGIKNGVFNDVRYTDAVIYNDSIILEGDENLLLRSNVIACYIDMKDVVTTVAEILQDEHVRLSGIEAIPEGQERSILKSLLS